MSDHIDRATRTALATPTDSVAQLENAAVVAWRNLIGPDGFLPVLILLFLAVIAAPLIGNSEPGLLATVLVSAAALVLTVYRSTHRIGVRRGILTYSAVAVLATVAAYVASRSAAIAGHHLTVIVVAVNLVVLLTAFPLVLIRSFQHRRVTVNTV